MDLRQVDAHGDLDSALTSDRMIRHVRSLPPGHSGIGVMRVSRGRANPRLS